MALVVEFGDHVGCSSILIFFFSFFFLFESKSKSFYFEGLTIRSNHKRLGERDKGYEASPTDLAFIRKSLLTMVSPVHDDTLEMIVNDFEKLIMHFEQLEYKDYLIPPKVKKNRTIGNPTNLIKHKLPNVDLFLSNLNVLNKTHQELVIQFWKDEQKRIKRPLVRKYWTILFNNNQGFGDQNLNKLAFAPRTVTKMQLRKSNRILSGVPLAEKLLEFYEENRKALYIVKMIKQRETLKFHQNLLKYRREKSGKIINEIIDNQVQVTECIKIVNEEFEKNNIVVDVDTEKDDFERDTIQFLSNLIHESSLLGLNIKCINTPSQYLLENKVAKLKNSIQQKSNKTNKSSDVKGNKIISLGDVYLENPKMSLQQYVNYYSSDLSSPLVVMRKGGVKEYYIETLNPRKNEEDNFAPQNFVNSHDSYYSNYNFMDDLDGNKENSVNGFSQSGKAQQVEALDKRTFDEVFFNERFGDEIDKCNKRSFMLENYPLLDTNFFERFHRKIKHK